MDTTCLIFNKNWNEAQELVKSQADGMDNAIDATFQIFGPSGAFRKWDGEKYQVRKNRAIFDIMVFYFSESKIRTLAFEHSEQVRDAFKELCADTDFVRTSEATTKSLSATQLRLSEWGKSLSKAIGLPIKTPKIGKA